MPDADRICAHGDGREYVMQMDALGRWVCMSDVPGVWVTDDA